jgi:UDP-glucose 6-dehydrogenase|tara:strand:+ start:1657 stop:2037 length:381 start_codon:yes stop_codon:yes gene_type:complete
MVNLVVTQGMPTNVAAMEALYVVVMTMGKQLGVVIMDWGTHSVVIIVVNSFVVAKYAPMNPSNTAMHKGNANFPLVVETMGTDIVILVGWIPQIGDTAKRFTRDKVVNVVVMYLDEAHNAQATTMD